MHLIETRNLPRHVGIIMDGNGRWAEMRGKPREAGHKAGSAAVRRVVRVARRLGIDALTLYAFSEQNWGRPEGEVDALMGLLHEYLVSERDELVRNRGPHHSRPEHCDLHDVHRDLSPAIYGSARRFTMSATGNISLIFSQPSRKPA